MHAPPVPPTSLAPGRHWADVTGQGAFGLDTFSADVLPPGSSALVYVDSGNTPPPNGNVPPRDQTDPHGDPRSDPHAHAQKVEFLLTGSIRDVRDGQPYFSHRCRGPFHPAFGSEGC